MALVVSGGERHESLYLGALLAQGHVPRAGRGCPRALDQYRGPPAIWDTAVSASLEHGAGRISSGMSIRRRTWWTNHLVRWVQLHRVAAEGAGAQPGATVA